MIDEIIIITQKFVVIPRVAKWHAVLFEDALLIKFTTISMLFVIK